MATEQQRPSKKTALVSPDDGQSISQRTQVASQELFRKAQQRAVDDVSISVCSVIVACLDDFLNLLDVERHTSSATGMALFWRYLNETGALFVCLTPLLVYSVVVPFINALTEPYDTDCYAHRSAFALHSMLFFFVVAISVCHDLASEIPSLDLSPVRLHLVSKHFLSRFRSGRYDRWCIFFALFMRFIIVTFWSLALGPQPLACWIQVLPDEFFAFELSRSLVIGSVAAALFVLLFVINYYGRPVIKNCRDETIETTFDVPDGLTQGY